MLQKIPTKWKKIFANYLFDKGLVQNTQKTLTTQ